MLGVSSEPPIVGVERALQRRGIPHLVVDQRDLAIGDWTTWSSDGWVEAMCTLGDGTQIAVDSFTGVYTRVAAWRTVLADEFSNDHDGSFARHVYGLHERLDAWLETTSMRVANRTRANDTNNSKPLQAMLIRRFFHVPATLVTNDPAAALAFRDEFGSVIFKSCSGERSIVTELADDDLERLDLLATVPVQFQEKLDGQDVRVHVVGREVFATAIESSATDYRYDASGSSMRATEVSDEVADACVRLTSELGLEISGIDLRYCSDGRVSCFEVNPSPAYIVYEEATGQPIADALARHLAGW